jgi:1-acyl-sn-glycerol-3-phosphate acyltransferase
VELVVKLLHLARRYFRAEVKGLEHVPTGPALLVGNHNAGITMMEPFMLGMAWHLRERGQDGLYYLGHDALVTLPILRELLTRVGVIRASARTTERALRAGKKVVVFPGGNYEAFRPYWDRHVVDFKGRTGFVALALRHQIPIIPVMSIGGHETFFVLSRGEGLARWLGFRERFRSDSCPIFFGLPWGLAVGPIFHFPLPSKLLIEVGPAVDLEGYGAADADDPIVLRRLSDKVRTAVQQMMTRRAAERRWPVLG